MLIYHDIAPCDEDKFARQIDWLSKHWAFITPSVFDEVMSGKKQLEQNSLLLTFDDGFFSTRIVVEKILNPRDIQALFFIVSDFYDISDIRSARELIAANMYPDQDIDTLPLHLKNMGKNDLEYLIDHGHMIGAHTATHARLSAIPKTDLQQEIVKSADKLEQDLGITVNHFAFTFGDLASFSSSALSVARDRFKFVFTGMRGNNNQNTPHWAIRRDSMQSTDSLMLSGAFLQGAADPIYKKSLTQYHNWGITASKD